MLSKQDIFVGAVTVVMLVFSLISAIGGMVMVAQMILEFGDCTYVG